MRSPQYCEDHGAAPHHLPEVWQPSDADCRSVGCPETGVRPLRSVRTRVRPAATADGAAVVRSAGLQACRTRGLKSPARRLNRATGEALESPHASHRGIPAVHRALVGGRPATRRAMAETPHAGRAEDGRRDSPAGRAGAQVRGRQVGSGRHLDSARQPPVSGGRLRRHAGRPAVRGHGLGNPRRAAVSAVGRRPHKAADGRTAAERSQLAVPADRHRADAHHAAVPEGRADARPGHHPERAAGVVPADLHRRPVAAAGSGADLEWLFGRQVGRRHAGRAIGRLPRRHVAGRQRQPADRSREDHRALPPHELRHARHHHHRRRPEGVHGAVDHHDPPPNRPRHRAHRLRVPGEREGHAASRWKVEK